VVIALGVTGGVLFAAFEEPIVDVTNTTIKELTLKYNALNVPEEVHATFDVTIRVDNPSRPPIGATVKDVRTKLFSLDRQAADGIGKPVLLALGNVDGEVKIEPESITDFSLLVTTTSETAKSPEVVARVARDCNTNEGLTKLRVHIEQVILEVFSYDVVVEAIDVEFELGCSSSEAAVEGGQNAPAGAQGNAAQGGNALGQGVDAAQR